ncbi:alpha/beta fold hydrolase [Paenibacillus spongiae]|uniref:Alpha/beta hydrolase n=1 Tax=Paenibacillus spongiae TaxID=2909671 RepID=A0ABY5SCT0_9BACL|nr:alpha/beta hydrolase [Paenibacillus spongiae]UVI31751.1 alpha/beta hydrolase [Paenibacillus spongiae]
MPFFRLSDVSLHFHEEGSGVPILCVHPPCLSSRLFTYIRTELSGSHRIITMDMRGHGRSEPGNAPLALPLIAEDMRRLLDKCEVREAYVCSYGAGSFPALTALISYPDRFRGGIIVSGTAAYTDIVNRSKLQAAYVSSVLQAKSAVAFQAAWSEADNRTAFHALNEEAKLGDAMRWKEYVAACLNGTLQRQLPQIRQQMLILYGSGDQAGRDYAQNLYKRLPNAEIYCVLRAQRQLLMKQPAKTAAVIRQWLDKQEEPSLADTYEERSALLQELAEQGIEPGGEYPHPII